MTVVGWKIWYADGTIFSPQNGSWDTVPDDGVVEVVVYFDGLDGQDRYTREVFSGDDWYFSDGAQLFGSNSNSLATNQSRYPQCSFKQGMWVSADEMNHISALAIADYGL